MIYKIILPFCFCKINILEIKKVNKRGESCFKFVIKIFKVIIKLCQSFCVLFSIIKKKIFLIVNKLQFYCS